MRVLFRQIPAMVTIVRLGRKHGPDRQTFDPGRHTRTTSKSPKGAVRVVVGSRVNSGYNRGSDPLYKELSSRGFARSEHTQGDGVYRWYRPSGTISLVLNVTP